MKTVFSLFVTMVLLGTSVVAQESPPAIELIDVKPEYGDLNLNGVERIVFYKDDHVGRSARELLAVVRDSENVREIIKQLDLNAHAPCGCILQKHVRFLKPIGYLDLQFNERLLGNNWNMTSGFFSAFQEAATAQKSVKVVSYHQVHGKNVSLPQVLSKPESVSIMKPPVSAVIAATVDVDGRVLFVDPIWLDYVPVEPDKGVRSGPGLEERHIMQMRFSPCVIDGEPTICRVPLKLEYPDGKLHFVGIADASF